MLTDLCRKIIFSTILDCKSTKDKYCIMQSEFMFEYMYFMLCQKLLKVTKNKSPPNFYWHLAAT